MRHLMRHGRRDGMECLHERVSSITAIPCGLAALSLVIMACLTVVSTGIVVSDIPAPLLCVLLILRLLRLCVRQSFTETKPTSLLAVAKICNRLFVSSPLDLSTNVRK